MNSSQKIYARCSQPDCGHIRDMIAIRQLDKNKMYRVGDIHMGQSHTSVILAGIDDVFNSVNFDFFIDKDNELVRYDIFSDPNINPYISSC